MDKSIARRDSTLNIENIEHIEHIERWQTMANGGLKASLHTYWGMPSSRDHGTGNVSL
jgi:hypothetical protein